MNLPMCNLPRIIIIIRSVPTLLNIVIVHRLIAILNNNRPTFYTPTTPSRNNPIICGGDARERESEGARARKT